MGDIVIEETNYKAFAFAMASLFLLLAAAAVMIYGFMGKKMNFWLPGLTAVFIFLMAFIRGVIRVTDVKTLLTITRDGVVDNSSLGGVGFIAYDDIKEFQIIKIYNSEAIAVIPKNMDGFISKFTIGKRRQIKKNIYLNLPPVVINVDMAKDMEPEDILSLLQKRLIDYSSLYE